jgi:hypothetical protein
MVKVYSGTREWIRQVGEKAMGIATTHWTQLSEPTFSVIQTTTSQCMGD